VSPFSLETGETIMAHANQPQEAITYFNLHTVGIGYLNRVREVQVRRGQPFMACDIAACTVPPMRWSTPASIAKSLAAKLNA
jgi:hypothetical protein